MDANGVITGEWQHIVITQTSSGLATIYVDAVAAASDTIWLADPAPRVRSDLGRSAHSGDALLKGSLDEVSIYTEVLTAAQVKAHFRAGR